MSGKSLRIVLVFALVLVAFAMVLGSAYAQGTTGNETATPEASATMGVGAGAAATATVGASTGAGTGAEATSTVGAATSGGAAATATAATPRTLPTTGGSDSATNTVTIVLLALGATAGLGGLLLRGLRRPL